LRSGRTGERAHEIAQDHEGIADFDWLHALCHRIEGDDWNAGYWYRRAGRERGHGAIEAEWKRSGPRCPDARSRRRQAAWKCRAADIRRAVAC
jgi:hypothetical protein